jgi:ABC-type sugar transport system ATPase subunit
VRSGAHGVRIDAGPLRIPSYALAVADLVDREVIVGIRPTDLVAADPEDTIVLEEAVRRVAVLGAVAEVTLDADGIPIVAVLPRPWPRPGELVRLRVDPTRIHLFSPTGPGLAHGI